jgi:hypothetical protein
VTNPAVIAVAEEAAAADACVADAREQRRALRRLFAQLTELLGSIDRDLERAELAARQDASEARQLLRAIANADKG